MHAEDTIAALATPWGESALAVLRASGPRCTAIACELLGGAAPVARVATHLIYRSVEGRDLDDVVAVYFAGPASYTGEDSLEISCHGSPFIAQCILQDLLARGCRPALPGEFTRRAFLSGRIDLNQAEAVLDLIRARSDRALDLARKQSSGAFSQRIQAVGSQLLDLCAQVEAYIDFPEEDLPPEQREAWVQESRSLLAQVGRMRATARYGQLVRDGIRVAILGAPNAGKSSLLNQLCGENRAIVHEQPGTTRDYLEASLHLGGHRFILVDTAGIRSATDSIEREGIRRALEQARQADLCLWVADATAPLWPESVGEIDDRDGRYLFIINKIDIAATSPIHFHLSAASIQLSALTGKGMEDLKTSLIQWATMQGAAIGSEEFAINQRHAAALLEVESSLTSAIDRLEHKSPDELLAADLRNARVSLGDITGAVEHEQVLDRIFSKFCIGK